MSKFHDRYSHDKLMETEEQMLNELVGLPVDETDPYSISLHLKHRYAEAIGFFEDANPSTSSVLGTASYTPGNTDLTKKRYMELINLDVPEGTNMSIDELLNLPSSEFRFILETFRDRAARLKKITNDIADD